MSFEVEVKYRTNDHAGLLERLRAMGAQAGPEVIQEDGYLGHPARDFAQTNEALRIRRVGDSNRVTYKGPRLGGPTKTREEIEIGFEGGPSRFEQLRRLFTNLGFRPVATVRKSRTPFHLDYRGRRVEVALDVAEGLGTFAEVEALAADENDLPAAQAAVLELGRELGLSDVEPRSYLRMHLEQQAG